MSNSHCRFASLLLAASVLIIEMNVALAEKAGAVDGKVIRLFNGQNFEGWYVYTTQTGYTNPDVFQVLNGMIYVPGGKGDTAYFGGLITKQPYKNYRLRLEYKWGEATYGTRKGKARDAGVLLHCIGPNEPGPWMTSYEFQIIEGGTGDLLVVNCGGVIRPDDQVLTGMAEVDFRNQGMYFKPAAPLNIFKTGDRVNWWGRDSTWKDKLSFRGSEDVESPHGEWTKCEIVARGDKLEFYVNGKIVNRASNLSVVQGKILLQTEGAEIWYRNIELTPMDP